VDRVRVSYTDHLVDLVARAEAAAARLTGADADLRRAAAVAAARESARLSLRLDGSPLTDETADAVDAGTLPAVRPSTARPEEDRRGWATVLRVDAMATQDLAAVEYANLLACAEAEPGVAERFFDDPLGALAELHGVIVRDLVAPDVVGQLRRTDQAVHDGAQGRMIYRAVDPAALPDLLDGLAAWLGTRSVTLPALVVAGVVHERILEWQPYEAANGRLARVASRVVLRARGLDLEGLAVPERELAADPLDYYGEVAATIHRRGDLELWLERWGEVLLAALERAADALVPRERPAPPARALAAVSDLDEGEDITLAGYARRIGASLTTAQGDLRALAAAGVLVADPRTKGLRFRRPHAGEPNPNPR
jgi:hypothetical protein